MHPGVREQQLDLHNQTFSHPKLLTAQSAQNKLKNRKRSQINAAARGASGHLGGLSLSTLGGQKTQTNLSTNPLGGHIGLDFLDVKKEIKRELKQIDKKVHDRCLVDKRKAKEKDKHENTMVIIQDSSIQDLRLDHWRDSQLHKVDGHNLRSKSSSPMAEGLQALRE